MINFQIQNMDYIDSELELKEILSHIAEPKFLHICSESSTANQCKLIRANDLTVGLLDYSFGIGIQIEELEQDASFLLGHERELDCISIKSGQILWSVYFGEIFYEFEIIQEKNIIIIID